MNTQPPQDTRRAPRRQVSDLVPVTDQMRDSVVGRLGNVSETGMLMLASVPLREDALYQLLRQWVDEDSDEGPVSTA